MEDRFTRLIKTGNVHEIEDMLIANNLRFLPNGYIFKSTILSNINLFESLISLDRIDLNYLEEIQLKLPIEFRMVFKMSKFI